MTEKSPIVEMLLLQNIYEEVRKLITKPLLLESPCSISLFPKRGMAGFGTDPFKCNNISINISDNRNITISSLSESLLSHRTLTSFDSTRTFLMRFADFLLSLSTDDIETTDKDGDAIRVRLKDGRMISSVPHLGASAERGVSHRSMINHLLQCKSCKHLLGSTKGCPDCELYNSSYSVHRSAAGINLVTGTDVRQTDPAHARCTDTCVETIKKLDDLEPGDWDTTHVLADRYLLEFLDAIGFKHVADAYRSADERCEFKTS